MRIPDKEPKVTKKKSKAKAKAKHRTRAQVNTGSTGSSLLSEQSPTGLASPMSHLNLQNVKQEPSVERNRLLSPTHNRCSFQEQRLAIRQRDIPNSVNSSFSASDSEYLTPQVSSIQSVLQSHAMPALGSSEASNLGLSSLSPSVFGATDSSTVLQRLHDRDNSPQNPMSNDCGSSPTLASQYQIHPSWNLSQIANEEQSALQSSLPFSISPAGTTQSFPACSQQMALMNPATPYMTEPRYFLQDLDSTAFVIAVSSQPQGALLDSQSMPMTERYYNGMQ